MTTPDREARTLASLETCTCPRPSWAHQPPFACTIHGPCCDFNLTDHPLPTPTYRPVGPTHGSDNDADPTGRMADQEAARVENNLLRAAERMGL